MQGPAARLCPWVIAGPVKLCAGPCGQRAPFGIDKCRGVGASNL